METPGERMIASQRDRASMPTVPSWIGTPGCSFSIRDRSPGGRGVSVWIRRVALGACSASAERDASPSLPAPQTPTVRPSSSEIRIDLRTEAIRQVVVGTELEDGGRVAFAFVVWEKGLGHLAHDGVVAPGTLLGNQPERGQRLLDLADALE